MTEGLEACGQSGSVADEAPGKSSVLIRPAKLCIDRREMPCVVLGLSGGVAKAKIFEAIPDHRRLFLEFASGERHEIVLVWQTDGQFGFFFAGEVDEATLGTSGDKRLKSRKIRILLKAEAHLWLQGRPSRALLIDISQEGAGVVCSVPLRTGETVRLEAKGLPAAEATVRWAEHPRYGLALDRIFALEKFAEVCAALQPSRTA